MHKTLLPFSAVSQLSKTDVAYATQDPALRSFYRYEPDPDGFLQAIESRKTIQTDRETLVAVLRAQYQGLADSEVVQEQITLLLQTDTFSVTTAHQPTLLLGPLYFVYKAISTINLAIEVQKTTGKQIIPIFVLGSEDHDLDELNHIRLFNKEIRWTPDFGGPVGTMPAATLGPVLEELRPILGDTENAHTLWEKIEQCYTQSATFADATQALLHTLFGRFGLVVFNMNHPDLKRKFIPIMWDDLSRQTAHRLVTETIEKLASRGFKGQAIPRDINLFYMQPGSRERIVFENGQYQVLHTDLSFTPETMKTELEQYPERFSPNVLLRPLFQELILPNLAYVGGGGELAYWLERSSLFEHYGVPYPILIRRNSVLWFDKDSIKRSLKFGFSPARYFEDSDALVRAYVEGQADAEVHLKSEVVDLQEIYDKLAQKAQAIDPTLEKAVRADEVKMIAHLQQWESRLVRAEKQKHEVAIGQLRSLREKLFPVGSLQERHDNFIPYYLRYGERYLDMLKENLNPFDAGFIILEDCD
ncbi:MAG: bacillithiol biosynthesis cysteine-adding enzyme BshC [Saprospiraceae bacterium]|jgi:bacillithiol biosynthesis cysteine-adding enzyme BshC|nr:bacillithiol biosynthesis cysteine-adding enzyme BshC [Saprospiraceae bacterium]